MHNLLSIYLTINLLLDYWGEAYIQ